MPTGVYQRTEKNRHSPETIGFLREINSGKNNPMFGKTTSIKQKEAVSRRMLGNQHALGKKWTNEMRQKHSLLISQRKYSDDIKKKWSEIAKKSYAENSERAKKLSDSLKGRDVYWAKGEKNHMWNGGISKGYKTGYYSKEYKNWREEVFKRDNYTCRECCYKGYITAHHIKSFAYFPELRFEISNGLTLCESCHALTDNYKGRGRKKLLIN